MTHGPRESLLQVVVVLETTRALQGPRGGPSKKDRPTGPRRALTCTRALCSEPRAPQELKTHRSISGLAALGAPCLQCGRPKWGLFLWGLFLWRAQSGRAG